METATLFLFYMNKYNVLWDKVTRLIVELDPPTDTSDEGIAEYAKKINHRVEELTNHLCDKYGYAKVPVCGCCGERILWK